MARELRDKARTALAEGKDPAEKQQEELTFREVTAEWLEKQRGACTGKYFSGLSGKLFKWLLPRLGDIPVTQLTPRRILDAVQRVEDLGYEATAHILLATVGRITSYARMRGYCEHSAGSGLSGALRKHTTVHNAAVTDSADAGKLLRNIYGYRGPKRTQCALRLLPYIFLRPIELLTMRWEDVHWDVEEIVLPPERMKGKREHVIPMAAQVKRIFNELYALRIGDGYVLCSRIGSEKHLSKSALRRALLRIGYAPGEVTLHGFRSTAGTLLNELGFNPDAAERQLAHREPNTTRASYNRAQYMPERRAMMQAWADYLDKLRIEAL